MNESNRQQQNIEKVLSGRIERNVKIAMKLVPDNTFTLVNSDQFIKLIKLGVEIPLQSQTDILDKIEPQFLGSYAALAEYTPEQVSEKPSGKYGLAESIMVTTWSFWFDYLKKLKKELTVEAQSETGPASMIGRDQGVMQSQGPTGEAVTLNDEGEKEKMNLVAWGGGLSKEKESLELVDDVWAEFVKAGMD